MEVPCSLVKETEIPRVEHDEADQIMENLMNLSQNTAVSLFLLTHESQKRLFGYCACLVSTKGVLVQTTMSVAILFIICMRSFRW